MSEFVPPFPPRTREARSLRQLLRLWRTNLLAIWQEDAFESGFLQARVLRTRVFICNSPAAVQFALSQNNASFERKGPQHRHALKPLLGDGLFVSDGETWRARRRIVAPIVHVSQLKRFAPTMERTASELRARWEALPPGTEVDVLSEMANLAAEIICRTVFGQELGSRNSNAVVESFSEYQRLIDQTDLPSLLGLPDWFPRWRSPALRRSIRRIHAVLDGIVQAYRSDRAGNADAMIGALIDAKDPATGRPLGDEAIRNEAAVLFMAGHETTANSLAWTWYLLSQDAEAEAKLHAELDGMLGGRAPTLADVPRLAYTRAVFEETLRLYPPVPFLTREALEPQRFEGVDIPKGSMILVSPWLLHRHRGQWAKPDHFMPERFLASAPNPAGKFNYIPFAVGPRVCPGLAFGMTEAVICIATLAQRFTPRLRPGHRVEPVCRLTLRPGDELPMTLVRREPAPRTVPPPDLASDAAARCPYAGG